MRVVSKVQFSFWFMSIRETKWWRLKATEHHSKPLEKSAFILIFIFTYFTNFIRNLNQECLQYDESENVFCKQILPINYGLNWFCIIVNLKKFLCNPLKGILSLVLIRQQENYEWKNAFKLFFFLCIPKEFEVFWDCVCKCFIKNSIW